MAYVVLVAVPLLGLAGVLKGGRRLVAPPSVDGMWSMQLDSAQLSSLPCGKTLAATPDKTIAISQSGRTFVLSFPNGPKANAIGNLEGSSMHVSVMPSPEWSAENGCGNGRALTLLATVDAKARPRSLAGSFSIDDCPTCRPVEFRAVQQSAPSTKGAR